MDKYNILDQVLKFMPCYEGSAKIQRIQTLHRIDLAEFWEIPAGAKILEIGCGQGDTTAVLAYLVGADGLVHGVDIGPRDYGSPLTIGESTDYIRSSEIGKQIKVDFEFDILNSEIDFEDEFFDMIVLSHCSFYMKSPEELIKIFKRIRHWGKQLCFAEWDTRISDLKQYPHLLSILLQAQYECFKENSFSNIRTFFTPDELKRMAITAGWKIVREASVPSSELQDARWEIDIVMSSLDAELEQLEHVPEKFKALLRSELLLLESATLNADVTSMSTFTFVAK